MEPPLWSSESPCFEEEPELTREALAEAASSRGVELRPLLNALSLALAVVLVIVAASMGIQRLRSQLATSAATLTPTIPTPTLPLTRGPTLPAGQEWTRAGPSWSQQIVFAPSQPQIAYTCGTPANSNISRQALVALGISRDAGHTWQTTTTRVLATLCQVDVDPVDAHDLLLQTENCAGCPPFLTHLYRSFDSGQSWHLITLPPLPGSGSATFTAYQWAWQRSALFVSPYVMGTQFQSVLAISLAEGPLAWVNLQALQAGVPSSLQLNTVYATSSTVYADFTGPSSCTGTCEVVKHSVDLGFTWSVFAPHYRSHPVQLLDQLVNIADGRTLIGQVFPTMDENTRIYVSSSDGGTTWTPLPSPPDGLVIFSLASTPSGILYVQTQKIGVATTTPAVYRLAPGARGWMLLSALPVSPFLLVVSWDEQGNPLALWSGASAPQSALVIVAGLTIHAP